MELITMHSHTGFTNHGEGSVEQVAQTASAAGITSLAFTEHYPLSLAFDPQDYLAMREDRLEEYCADVVRVKNQYPAIDILLGCELDWLGADDDRDLVPSDFDRFDLVLGSVHYVDKWPFDDPAQREHWGVLGTDYIWNRYFDLWCEAVCSDMPFTIMSHPDLVKKFNFHPSFDPSPLYRRAAEAAHEAQRMVEVNTSGSYYACKEMFPCLELLTEFCRAGVPCTLGTDAHVPAYIARDIEQGYKLMFEAGYREVTVPMSNGDRRSIALT